MGFVVNTGDSIRKDAFLYGEGQSRVLVSDTPEQEEGFLNYLRKQSIIFTKLGETVSGNIQIDGEDYGAISEWRPTYNDTLGMIPEL